MLPLLILSVRIDQMIKNPALKLKNRLFNLSVLLALYLEFIFQVNLYFMAYKHFRHHQQC